MNVTDMSHVQDEYIFIIAIGFFCGILKVLNVKNVTCKRVINSILGSILLCFCVEFILYIVEDLSLKAKLGISAIVTLWGVDKTYNFLNKVIDTIVNLRKK